MRKDLDYFVGKICSVFVSESCRDFKAEDYPTSVFNYFLGTIESIDSDGLMLSQTNKWLKTFIFKSHLIAIAEEEVIDPEKPEHAKFLKSMNMPTPSLEIEPTQTKFVDPKSMGKIMKDIQTNFSQ